MSSVFSALLVALLALVVLWITVFGSAGRILSRRSDLSAAVGFVTGAMFGPLGLGFILWRGRSHVPHHSEAPSVVATPTTTPNNYTDYFA